MASDTINPFVTRKLPKTSYADVNELANDIASVLEIRRADLIVSFVPLPDLKGEKGDRGKTGPKGAQGDKGDTGAQGPAGVLLWRGDWDGGTENYSINDLVLSDGDVYICTIAHVSAAATEPGVGASWGTVWDRMITLPTTYTTLQTSEPNGGTPVPFKIGGYTAEGSLTPSGYIISEVDGVKYKILATPV